MTDTRRAKAALARRWLALLARLARSPHFWAAQALVAGITAAHDLLEASGAATNSLVDVLPVSFIWVPLMYASLEFGISGAAVTSVLVLLGSITNWLYLQQPEALPHEVSQVLIAVAVSLLIGHQVDVTTEARRRARDYLALAVNRQESERKRISLALHDDSVQTLIAVCHQIDDLKTRPESSSNGLSDLRASLSSVIHDLRNLSASLRPPVLDESGLVPALRSLLGEVAARAGLLSQFDVEGVQPVLTPEVSEAAYRIVQEALRNVERHARANRVAVDLTFRDDELRLQIIDDGIGFDSAESTSSAAADKHLGLFSMRERAEMLGGHLEISSRPGEGTRILASIPVSAA